MQHSHGFFVAAGALNLNSPYPLTVVGDLYIQHDAMDYVGCTTVTNNRCNGHTTVLGAQLDLGTVEFTGNLGAKHCTLSRESAGTCVAELLCLTCFQ